MTIISRNKSVIFTAVTLASVFAIVACTKDKAPESARVYDVEKCVFPDAPTQQAPEWVCNESVQGVAVASVGTYEKSKAGISFMEQQAATAARVKLAQQIRVEVQNMIKQYAETTGKGDSETVDQVNSSVTKQITDEKLAGTRILKKVASATGTLYVLVGIDEEQLKVLAKQSALTSMNNDQALWQQFKAEKSFDELSTEIANQRKSN